MNIGANQSSAKLSLQLLSIYKFRQTMPALVVNALHTTTSTDVAWLLAKKGGKSDRARAIITNQQQLGTVQHRSSH